MASRPPPVLLGACPCTYWIHCFYWSPKDYDLAKAKPLWAAARDLWAFGYASRSSVVPHNPLQHAHH